MLRLTVKLGQAVDIEDVGRIHVIERSGRSVRLGFETDKGPIKIVEPRDDNKLTRRQQHME